MAVLSNFLTVFRRTPAGGAAAPPVVPGTEEEKKEASVDNAAVDNAAVLHAGDKPESERPGEDLQRGVQHVEAVTLTWSKASLIAVFLKYSPALRAPGSTRARSVANTVPTPASGCSTSSTPSSRPLSGVSFPSSRAISSLTRC
jgi:hypothetical protein